MPPPITVAECKHCHPFMQAKYSQLQHTRGGPSWSTSSAVVTRLTDESRDESTVSWLTSAPWLSPCPLPLPQANDWGPYALRASSHPFPLHPTFQDLNSELGAGCWRPGSSSPPTDLSLTYGGDKGGVEGVIWKSEQYTCLSHTRVAYEEELE